MGYYSFNRPLRDGRLSWPCWLTDSGRLTHKVVTRPAISLAQDRESSPAVNGVLTTMLRALLLIGVYMALFINRIPVNKPKLHLLCEIWLPFRHLNSQTSNK